MQLINVLLVIIVITLWLIAWGVLKQTSEGEELLEKFKTAVTVIMAIIVCIVLYSIFVR
jgi:hypothetical protein